MVAMLDAPGVRPGWQRLSRWGQVGKQPGSWALEPAGLPLLRIPASPEPPAGWGEFMENGGGGVVYRRRGSLLW